MPQNNDPGLVHKALAKAQSVESRLNQLIAGMSPEAPSIVYNANTTVVTTSTAQTTTFTVPAGVTSIQVECWGAGAGAGGGGTGEGGEGGGGGEYASEPNYPVTPGQVLSYTVGGGGTGGSTGNSGNGGADTFFDFPGSGAGGVYAHGGSPGSGFVGGSGGTGSVNTVHFDGGAGGGSGSQGTGGCGGGGAGGPDGAGLNGSTSSSSTGVAGGAGDNNVSPGTSGGSGGAGGNSAANGSNGGSPGAGAGGCGAATGVTSLNKTYNATITRSWYGSDATGNPNATRNTNGVMYQGGETASGGTYNGNQKSACLFNTQQIQADFAGYNMSNCTLTIHNQHSWYSSMTVQFNEWNVPTLPSSLPSSWNGTGGFFITSGTIAEGTTHTYSFNSTLASQFIAGTTIGFAFTPGGGNYNLNYYGYFSGGSNPVLQLSGTIGGTPVNAGNGADGQVRITYTTPSTIVAAVQPAAGTDSNGNHFTGGVSAQGVMQYAVATPSTPPSGTALQYATSNGTPSYINDAGYNAQISTGQGNIQSFTANSGTETAVTAAWPIPANDANVGTCYRLKAFGVGTYSSGSNTWLQAHVGGSGQAQAAYVSLPASFLWEAEADMIVVTTGSSGTILVKTLFLVSAAGAQANPSVIIGMTGGTGGTTVTFNTAASTTMALTSAGNGTFSIKGLSSTFERIGA